MKINTRTGYTQAISNLTIWKFLIIEIILLSITTGIYFQSMYIFLITMISLTGIFYIQITAVIFSILFSLFVALFLPILIAGIDIYQSQDIIWTFFSTPISKVFALLIFCGSYFLNYSGSVVLREVMEPMLGSLNNLVKSKKKEV
tara:strand:+ start:5240 stop:5674 length:435 start_codon:yes stop_codon:yes gene_type:complete